MPKRANRSAPANLPGSEGMTSRYRTPLDIEPLCLRIPAAIAFVGISRSKLYDLIASGEVETVKLGSATLVLTESLRALVEARRVR